MERILKGISNLIKGEIRLDLFIQAYNTMKKENLSSHLKLFTNEGLELAGFGQEDITKLKE